MGRSRALRNELQMAERPSGCSTTGGSGRAMTFACRGLRVGPAPSRRKLLKSKGFHQTQPIHTAPVMTHVVSENCIKCKYTDCVDVCPVDCFREGPNMLVIDPDQCIDCANCIPECPENDIYAEEDMTADHQ